MKRIDFLKGLASTFGISVIPLAYLKEYRKVYLLQTFVRGFQYNDGLGLLGEMQAQAALELCREPDNAYDECAIAVYFRKKKIGYLPAEEIYVLSRLMDANILAPLAEIVAVEADAASWEHVHIAVYVMQELNDEVPSYLISLEPPVYYTLGNRTLGLDAEDELDVPDGDSFYEELVNHSETDEIYGVIHSGFSDPQKMAEAVKRSAFIVNTGRMPADLKADTLLKAMDGQIITLDGFFEEDNFVLANLRRIIKLCPRILEFEERRSLEGNLFFEVIFK